MGTKNITTGRIKNNDRPNKEISCECGCGGKLEEYKYCFAPSVNRVVWYKRRFIKGHRIKGISPNAETRRKIAETLKGHKVPVETRNKIRESMKKHTKKLSEIHKGNLNPAKRVDVRNKMSLAQKGTKSIRYIDGRSYRRGPNWKEERKLALERDNYTCQTCRKKTTLQVHHKIPWNETQDNSLENLITLCVRCHGRIEGKRGWGIPKS